MANPKDQRSDPPVDPTMAEKSLHDDLRSNAFYSLLLAFKFETSTIGKIMEILRTKWNISHETRVSFEDNIEANLAAQQQRVDPDAKKTQIVEAKPSTISVRDVGLNRDTKATSSDIKNDGFFFPTDMTMNLDELQKKAYYEVVEAFAVESSAISGGKWNNLTILRQIQETWKISPIGHVKDLRKSAQPSCGEETEKAMEEQQKGQPFNEKEESSIVATAKIQVEKAEPSSTTIVIKIRVSSEDDVNDVFRYADYNAETEMARPVTLGPCECEWTHITSFRPEDIVWPEGHPGMPAQPLKACLKVNKKEESVNVSQPPNLLEDWLEVEFEEASRLKSKEVGDKDDACEEKTAPLQ